MLVSLSKDGKVKEYNDKYDIVIHCENEGERERTMNFLQEPLTAAGEGIKRDIISEYGSTAPKDFVDGVCGIVDGYCGSDVEVTE